jgi:hypothetical protein
LIPINVDHVSAILKKWHFADKKISKTLVFKVLSAIFVAAHYFKLPWRLSWLDTPFLTRWPSHHRSSTSMRR